MVGNFYADTATTGPYRMVYSVRGDCVRVETEWTDEIDLSIWSKWREGLEGLLYCYRPPVKGVVMTVKRLLVRRSDPRWGAGRWKSKT